MWKASEFITTCTTQERRWFDHRFGNTVSYADDGRVLTLYTMGRTNKGDVVIEAEDRYRGDSVLVKDLSTLNVGVPDHGYAMYERDLVYVERITADKWKWGWQPDRDSRGEWRALVTPRRVGMDALLATFNKEPTFAITNDLACREGDLLFNGLIVGTVTDDGLLIDPSHDYLLHDDLITVRKSMK